MPRVSRPELARRNNPPTPTRSAAATLRIAPTPSIFSRSGAENCAVMSYRQGKSITPTQNTRRLSTGQRQLLGEMHARPSTADPLRARSSSCGCGGPARSTALRSAAARSRAAGPGGGGRRRPRRRRRRRRRCQRRRLAQRRRRRRAARRRRRLRRLAARAWGARGVPDGDGEAVEPGAAQPRPARAEGVPGARGRGAAAAAQLPEQCDLVRRQPAQFAQPHLPRPVLEPDPADLGPRGGADAARSDARQEFDRQDRATRRLI